MREFSAALLAGGRSRRMGADKAFLPWDRRPLWQHQLAKLRRLSPRQILLSCRPEQPFPPLPGVMPVTDAVPDCGPLGGLTACLEQCRPPLLMVLGIDLPRLPLSLLDALLDASRPGCGAVIRQPESAGGWFEPLAAVYPVTLLAAARTRLAAGELSLQSLLRHGLSTGQFVTVPPPAEAANWFTNVNTPEDLPPG